MSDIKFDGEFVIIEGNWTRAATLDLMLDAPSRRTNTSGFRRALVHDFGDGLTMNYANDYPSGVAINGARLTPLTRISFAGEAITVDRRSISPPYTIEAIGDPDTLPARLAETSGGQQWNNLRLGFGVPYSVEAKQRIKLTGEAPERLYYARVLGDKR